jgi:uroporphyrinogen decarboxylase
MKRRQLKIEPGIVVGAAIDTQQLLPKTCPAEVRDHTRRMIDIVGKQGGYILGGSHSIQADCPDENIVAMRDEALQR